MVDRDAETLEITGLATRLASERSVPRGLALRVENGDQRGKTYTLGRDTMRVGTGAGCQIILDDPTASERHAEIIAKAGGVFVRDLGSTNGTQVAGTRVFEAMVEVGGEITMGQTKLRLIDGAAPPVEPSDRRRFGGLVGESAVMREVFAVLELASPTDATVLLEGPSGTGKEVAARAIHDHSERAAAPFVVFDCSSVTPSLITSSLMGHKKGAFTGASADRTGAFAEASGGTLFLDEVGELPLENQTHLLRALESSEVTPVGSDRAVKVDVRVVAATHRDLSVMVQRKEFRLDLMHRLAVVHLVLPALRDRLEDLPPLIAHFFEGRSVEPGAIAGPNLDALRAQAFDGNVRELRNILERSWVLSGAAASFKDLKLWIGPPAQGTEADMAIDPSVPFKDAKEDVVSRFEARYLPVLMEAAKGSISEAARRSGLSRRHMRALLVKHGLVSDNEG